MSGNAKISLVFEPLLAEHGPNDRTEAIVFYTARRRSGSSPRAAGCGNWRRAWSGSSGAPSSSAKPINRSRPTTRQRRASGPGGGRSWK